MATNCVEKGKTIDYTAGADIASGQFVMVGALAAVAITAIASGATGALDTSQVFDLPKGAEAITQGAKLYWDADGDPVGGVAGSGCLTTTATDNDYAGIAWAAADAGAALVPLKLNA